MKAEKANIFFKALLFFFMTIAIDCYANTTNLETQQKALQIISDFAERLCSVPLEGKANGLELSGNAQIELDKILKKLADLGFKGAAKYQSSKWQGVLQKDIAGLVKNKLDCKKEVFKDLKGKLLTSAAPEVAPSKYAGKLKPRSKVLLSARKNVLPQIELGDGGAGFIWGGPKGKAMFQFFNDNSFTIISEEGQVKVSTVVRNKNGVIVAELIKNEWKVNKNSTFDRNYSKNALEVKDDTGDIVLQIKVLADRIQFQGKFYDSKGNGVALGKHESGQGGIIEMTGPRHPQLQLKIEPIFEYPSDNHLGEFQKKKQS